MSSEGIDLEAIQLQRYEIYHDHPSCCYGCCGGGRVEKDPDDTGEWVKWADVQPLIAELIRLRGAQIEQIHESRSPDGDGQRHDQSLSLSPAADSACLDNREAGSEPADSHQPEAIFRLRGAQQEDTGEKK